MGFESLESWIRYLINIAPNIVIIVACVHYVKRVKTGDGILMITGTGIHLASYTFFMFYYEYFLDVSDLSGEDIKITNLISRIVTITAMGLFTTGFALAINKYLKAKKEFESQKTEASEKDTLT